MSTETHTEPEEIVDDDREVAEDALVDLGGIGVPCVSSEPSESEDSDKDEEGNKQ
jgi:hypothetical protein